MTVVSVISPSGQGDKTVDLPEEIFAAKVNVPLIHQVVVAQQAARARARSVRPSTPAAAPRTARCRVPTRSGRRRR
jgi:ribosomal protein L4